MNQFSINRINFLSPYLNRGPGHVFVIRSLSSSCSSCDALEPTIPPAPGTVKDYSRHILVKLPRPADAPGDPLGAWWSSHIERNPIIVSVFRSLAVNRSALGDIGSVKVTAYDDLKKTSSLLPSSTKEEEEEDVEPRCDVIIAPAGVRYPSLPVSLLEAVVAQGVADIHTSNAAALPPLPPLAAALSEDITRKLIILVCCHGARDGRCGLLGPQLAKTLFHLVKEKNLSDRVEVLASSHTGGHKYAGNVVVYGAMHPADGDWYGGLAAENADDFLNALLEIEVGVDGGAEDPMLRRWWRGRMGMGKEEQRELFDSFGEAAERDEES